MPGPGGTTAIKASHMPPAWLAGWDGDATLWQWDSERAPPNKRPHAVTGLSGLAVAALPLPLAMPPMREVQTHRAIWHSTVDACSCISHYHFVSMS